ncbi:hypothetical protein [aff. Roholtiella sp. LEGE 12411]|uniref:hypothetical protein n=1 Tax=aff. Roholtiella sp. LEGE 12411 TaxID=1828822 RepID=UPI001881AE26|nr:hypothetical protein [aff. Roholtiella sp. LEGE 12411]MBE9038479.1 hypothetical protein [aff. Roholtiella sp. LEGE 12411]
MMKNNWDSQKDSIESALLLPQGELYASLDYVEKTLKQPIDDHLVLDSAKELKNYCNERIICSTQSEIIVSIHSRNLGYLPSHLIFSSSTKNE